MTAKKTKLVNIINIFKAPLLIQETPEGKGMIFILF